LSAQTTSTTTTTTTTKKTRRVRKSAAPVTAEDLKALRDAIQAQQQQIQQLQNDLQQRDQKLQQMQEQIQQTQAATTDASTKADAAANHQAETVNSLQSTVADLKTNATNAAATAQEDQKRINEIEHPASIHYKGITITPVGFLAAEAVVRSHNENADILSTFSGIPFNGSANAHLSEFRGTARQSRLGALIEGKVGSTKLSGYYEMDFLGAAPTANENQSSSFNPRQRQLWAQVAFSDGLSFTGGQTWSLLTMNRKGIEPRGEWLPATIDAQYVVGYTFARLWTARVAKTFDDNKITAAFSVENPAVLVSSLNFPTNIEGFNNSALTASAGSGLANPPSVNLAPDVIAKVAFDPGYGHYELKAVGRFFRDRIAGAGTHTEFLGGIGAGMILPLVPKKADFVLQTLFGRGTGRFGDSSGVDITVRPDGSIVGIQNLQALGGFEFHPTPKLDWYLYGGDEYTGRAAYLDPVTAKGFGYGSPLADNSGCFLEVPGTAKCQANMRNLWEGTTGFWYRFFKGSYGTLQYGMQYAYFRKNTWTGIDGLAPRANQNIVMTSFRYYIP
jgi:hypothetical protein